MQETESERGGQWKLESERGGQWKLRKGQQCRLTESRHFVCIHKASVIRRFVKLPSTETLSTVVDRNFRLSGENLLSISFQAQE